MKNYFGVYLVSMLSFFKGSYGCDDNWLEYGSYCYFFPNKTLEKKSWKDASLSCQVVGAHLLSIQDEAENSFISSILKDDSTHNEKYWIGLNDACNNKEFEWSDNTKPQFFNWLPDQPNNRDDNSENCVRANSNGWNDNPCWDSVYNGFICKLLKVNNDSCADGWLNYKNYCYFFQNDGSGINWEDSYLSCLNKGANLLSVEDKEENEFVTSVLGSDSMKDNTFWIGLNYLQSYKRFVWSDNTYSQFFYWNPKVPNRNILNQVSNFSTGITRCIAINAVSWNIQNCKNENGYICKAKRGSSSCAMDWFEYASFCYYLQRANDLFGSTWGESLLSCLDIGGNLLSVDDQTENEFILNILQNYTSSKDYWIGLTDSWNNTWFVWSDNTYLQYASPQFVDLLHDESYKCVRVIKDRQKNLFIQTKVAWKVKECDMQYGLICKVKKAGSLCAENWVEFRRYCYFIQDMKILPGRIWEDSLSFCQSKGGNLLSIEDDEENIFIQNLIKDNEGYWIGLTKVCHRKFVWSDNTYSQFFKWIENQPSDFLEIKHCVEMNSTGWNDNNCNVLNEFVCKVKKVNLDYVIHGEEVVLTQGLVLGKLIVLKKRFTISFNLKPMSYSKNLKNVLQLISVYSSRDYSKKKIGVWFHDDGSGRLVINATVSGNSTYSVITDPFVLGKWYNIKIYQWQLNNKYWFAVDVDFVNIHRVENALAVDFKEIEIYVSNPEDDAQNGSVSNILIINGKAEYLVQFIHPLVKDKLIAEIPVLDKEYFISLDFNPNKFDFGARNIIHFTIGSDHTNYGDRTPGIWSNSKVTGVLDIASSINGFVDVHTFSTNKFEVNQWSNIVISQFYNGSLYIYTIRINKIVVFSIINNKANSFNNVKVYASNPWSEAQNCSIKNLFLINGNSANEMEPIIILPRVLTTSLPTNIISVAILVPVFVVLSAVIIAIAVLRFRRKKSQQSSVILNLNYVDNVTGFDKVADEWEIFPEEIILDIKIGEGAFGTVFIAKLNTSILSKRKTIKQKSHNILDINKNSNVAVKLVKDSADPSEINDFSEEMNLMKEIGYHKNIVNLIGCSTIKKPLCLIVEYMEHGDLLNFLRKNRTNITTNRDSFCLGLDVDDKANEIPLEKKVITPDNLLSFAWQVASGMEYLSCCKLVHRDLAARNILVGTGEIIKISDFGLSRKVNDELNYMSKKRRRLPVKWMSVEAIFDQMFTSFSDVWAYGVVLFEIVTLGGAPYPTINNRELLPLLKSGYRMERPENCSEAMYDIMMQCWNEDPLKRPTFTMLREYFDGAMSQSDCYFSFEIDENSAPMFFPFETEDDDNEVDDEVFENPVHVKSIEEIKKLSNKPIPQLEERYSKVK